MKPAIRYIEYPPRSSRMRNSQRSRPTYILIINQRPSIDPISNRNKRKMGWESGDMTKSCPPIPTVGAFRTQDNLFGSTFCLRIKVSG